jgi:5-methylcytosine-specific restriction endonuclease McrA
MVQGRVLLLNGHTWEPLSVISIPRAINLVLAEKAVVVEQSGEYLRTIRDKFPVPSVIALRTYVNVPRRQAHWSRRGVLVRDTFTCIYCGVQPGQLMKGKVMTKSDFTVDHVIPKSRGGRDTWMNTACACYACNHRKGDRLPHEAGMKMAWEPRTPRTSYLVVAIGSGNEAWRRYIEY